MRRIDLLINGKTMASFPLRVWHVERDGIHMFGLRFREVNIIATGGTARAVPGYSQLASMSVHGGQVTVTLFLFGRGFEFMFQERFPFLCFSIFKAEMDYDNAVSDDE